MAPCLRLPEDGQQALGLPQPFGLGRPDENQLARHFPYPADGRARPGHPDRRAPVEDAMKAKSFFLRGSRVQSSSSWWTVAACCIASCYNRSTLGVQCHVIWRHATGQPPMKNACAWGIEQ